jgi:hypothetical protein
MTRSAGALVLSRADLFELVWSKPMRELAQDFGMTDVALAKRCRRLRIPVPGRGYWARVDAGQMPRRPRLPEREERWGDTQALTVPPPSSPEAFDNDSAADENRETESTGTRDGENDDALRRRILSLGVRGATSIVEALPAVKRTAQLLKHPRRSALTFARAEKAAPSVAIEVSEPVLDRALLLADTLLRTADGLGWKFVAALPTATTDAHRSNRVARATDALSRGNVGQLLIDEERISFRIEERCKDEPRVPSTAALSRERREYGNKVPRQVQVATGKLRVVRFDTSVMYGQPSRRSWYDRKGSRVEDQLCEILIGFRELALSIKADRQERERQQRAFQEEEQRRKAQEARQQAHAVLIEQLETDAGAWHRARYLRRYIRAARRSAGQRSLRARFMGESVDFLDWAESYINQLDPLHPSQRSIELQAHRSGYVVNDLDRITASFARLLGSEWTSAWKMGNDADQRTDTERTFDRKSVFRVAPEESGGNA